MTWVIILGSVGVAAIGLVAAFNWDPSRLCGILSWSIIGLIGFVLIGVAIDSQAKPEKYYFQFHKKLRWLRSLKPEELASINQRANHEDILHSRRLGIFLTFNAFLGIAIGVNEPVPSLVFTILGFLIGLCWIRWTGNAIVTIRMLRDAGVASVDEKLWNKYVRNLPNNIGALNIFNKIIPSLLCLTWLTLGLHYTYSFAFDH